VHQGVGQGAKQGRSKRLQTTSKKMAYLQHLGNFTERFDRSYVNFHRAEELL
jgi:hypothetical protein